MHRDARKMLKSVGARLRDHRQSQKLPFVSLAKLAQVPKGNLSRIENGGNFTVATLYRLCWVLGVHPRDVLTEYRIE